MANDARRRAGDPAGRLLREARFGASGGLPRRAESRRRRRPHGHRYPRVRRVATRGARGAAGKELTGIVRQAERERTLQILVKDAVRSCSSGHPSRPGTRSPWRANSAPVARAPSGSPGRGRPPAVRIRLTESTHIRGHLHGTTRSRRGSRRVGTARRPHRDRRDRPGGRQLCKMSRRRSSITPIPKARPRSGSGDRRPGGGFTWPERAPAFAPNSTGGRASSPWPGTGAEPPERAIRDRRLHGTRAAVRGPAPVSGVDLGQVHRAHQLRATDAHRPEPPWLPAANVPPW